MLYVYTSPLPQSRRFYPNYEFSTYSPLSILTPCLFTEYLPVLHLFTSLFDKLWVSQCLLYVYTSPLPQSRRFYPNYEFSTFPSLSILTLIYWIFTNGVSFLRLFLITPSGLAKPTKPLLTNLPPPIRFLHLNSFLNLWVLAA